MSSAVADSGTVQAMTSLAMAPKSRLFFLPAPTFTDKISKTELHRTPNMNTFICINNPIRYKQDSLPDQDSDWEQRTAIDTGE